MADISQIKLLDNTTYDIKDANVPHSSLPAASGGSDLSLVTTGEKYLWGQAGASSLASLSDVTITTPANNNILQYDAANNIWINTDGKADRVPLPADYDSTATYAQGDFCIYSGDIYVCVTRISTPEAWDSNHWRVCYPQQDYLHSLDPTGSGSFSLNRRPGSTVGDCSFAEGLYTIASGSCAHAEGYYSQASGSCAHAEGQSQATGYHSHAEGNSQSRGYYTHSEGASDASGYCAHSEGLGNASGTNSHAEGYYTVANHKSQHVFGEFNNLDSSTASADNRGNYVEIVGNGTASNVRSNARTLDWSGNEELAGTLTTPGCNIQDSSQVTTISLTGSTGDITATSLNGVTIGAAPAFTDTTYGLSTSGNDVILSANGTAQDTITVPYATNSGTVNSLTVETAVPASAVFTDTTYTLGTSGNDVTLTPSSGTAQSITVPYATSAGSTQKLATLGRLTTPNTQYGDGAIRYTIVSSSMTTDKPNNNDGHLISIPWDNSGGYDSQIYIQNNAAGVMWIRGQSAGTWQAWKPVGVFTSTPTSGKVVVTDGTTGKIKSSGYGIAEGNTASTVVARNANNYIYATYYNAACGNDNGATSSSYALYVNSDGWIRKCSMSKMYSALGGSGCVQLYSGNLGKGSQTSFNYGSYSAYVVLFRIDGVDSGFVLAVFPKGKLGTSAQWHGYSYDGYNWAQVAMWYSGSTAYVKVDGSNANAQVRWVYGLY